MSTTPVTTEVTTAAKSAESWMQKHERIVIVSLVLAAGSWFGNHWIDARADHDNAAAAAAAQQLNDQKAKDAQLAAQVTQLNTQYQGIVAQLSAQNAALASAMQNRTVVLQQQQATDRTLPLPDLGNRWTALAGLAPGDLTASPTGITVTDTGARQTVETLEQVPVLTANLKDETTIADNRQTELTKANTLISGLNNQVDGLHTTISDEEKSCKAQVTAVKAEARKDKKNWFLRGLAIGAGIALTAVTHGL